MSRRRPPPTSGTSPSAACGSNAATPSIRPSPAPTHRRFQPAAARAAPGCPATRFACRHRLDRVVHYRQRPAPAAHGRSRWSTDPAGRYPRRARASRRRAHGRGRLRLTGCTFLQHPRAAECGDLVIGETLFSSIETLSQRFGPPPRRIPATEWTAWFTRVITEFVLPEADPTLLVFGTPIPTTPPTRRGHASPETVRHCAMPTITWPPLSMPTRVSAWPTTPTSS